MKDKEWLKEEIGELPCVDAVFNSDGSSYIDSVVPVMAVYDLIDELDEPETLSQKRIDDNIFEVDSWNKVVNVNLQNLLVPKQEELVSKADFENIKSYKEEGWTLANLINNRGASAEHDEMLAKAWLAYPNIEVEKEQEYYAKIKGHELVNDSEDGYWNVDGKELYIDNIWYDYSGHKTTKLTKDGWANLGINEDNADFVRVGELEE